MTVGKAVGKADFSARLANLEQAVRRLERRVGRLDGRQGGRKLRTELDITCLEDWQEVLGLRPLGGQLNGACPSCGARGALNVAQGSKGQVIAYCHSNRCRFWAIRNAVLERMRGARNGGLLGRP